MAMFAALVFSREKKALNMEFVMEVGTRKRVHGFVQPIQDNIPYFLTVVRTRGQVASRTTAMGGKKGQPVLTP
jgi:hypothetical protein